MNNVRSHEQRLQMRYVAHIQDETGGHRAADFMPQLCLVAMSQHPPSVGKGFAARAAHTSDKHAEGWNAKTARLKGHEIRHA